MIHKLIQCPRWVLTVIFSAVKRFWFDDCLSRAAALAYTSLFALVPLTALTIIMYTAVGVDEAEVGETLDYIMDHALPPVDVPDGGLVQDVLPEGVYGPLPEPKVDPSIDIIAQKQRNAQLTQLREDVTDYLLALGSNARTLGILTISVLFFIGVMLLNTIESALNVVWRVTSSLRSLVQKIINFWAVITFGPVFILLSIYLTTKAQGFGLANAGLNLGIVHYVHTLGAVFVSTLALTLLFFTLPAAKVRFRDAIFGALLSSLLFEVLKKGFAYYLSVSTGYSSLYGVLASVPLFLFWLYLTWVVILLGAEASYLSGKLHIISNISKYKTQMGEMGGLLGLRLIIIIATRYSNGQQLPTEGELSVETGVEPSIIRSTLDFLTNAELLSPSDPSLHSRSLMKAPQHILVSDVLDIFGVADDSDENYVEEESFLEHLREKLGKLDPKLKVAEQPISSLLLS